MQKLFEIFKQSENFSSKHFKYFDVYESLFKDFRSKDITFVEIGGSNVGSLDIWQKYFLKTKLMKKSFLKK
jgi:hypothetical protein